MLDHVFEWLRADWHGACPPLVDYITSVLEREVKEFEVWLPVAQLYVEAEVPFGEVTFKTVSKEMLDGWEAEMMRRLPEPPDAQAASLFFADRRRTIQLLAAVTVKARAVPDFAYEQALGKARIHLAMLRCLSAICTSPRLSLSCVLLGEEDLAAFQYFLMADGKAGIA